MGGCGSKAAKEELRMDGPYKMAGASKKGTGSIRLPVGEDDAATDQGSQKNSKKGDASKPKLVGTFVKNRPTHPKDSKKKPKEPVKAGDMKCKSDLDRADNRGKDTVTDKAVRLNRPMEAKPSKTVGGKESSDLSDKAKESRNGGAERSQAVSTAKAESYKSGKDLASAASKAGEESEGQEFSTISGAPAHSALQISHISDRSEDLANSAKELVVSDREGDGGGHGKRAKKEFRADGRKETSCYDHHIA